MEKIMITVGESSGDFIGGTNQIIQAAVDYVSFLGGGTVRLAEGVYQMQSTVHLRSGVVLEGSPGRTVLRQREERISAITADADLHERQVSVEQPELFPVGQTVAIRRRAESRGFGDTVAVVTGKDGNVLYLDRELLSTTLLSEGGIVTTHTPVLSGYDCNGVEIRGLIVEGNQSNPTLANGCRCAGIFLFDAHDVLIEDCSVRDYNGDGISYQHSSAIRVLRCESARNGGKGIHPGSGTKNTEILNSSFNENGMDGIFLCWRVQDSIVENCTAIRNRMSGLSIGHKDIRNLIRSNRLSENNMYGIFFRNESEPMAANYNRVEHNLIEDNGSEQAGHVGIRIRGGTHDVELIGNRICFSSAPPEQTIGICMEEHTGEIRLKDNEFVNCAMETHDHWLIAAK
ncbi:nitrous oxide reductase family maturation protein NosD [Paenibacillus sp. PAMC21692]|uniref:right-handed parallel beta-helix repeat-containing protein n=1 Tax=Paenibacillus sp. PAMC21692 TaxID=2762320 RepID=UPI00164E3E31|nr:right-handed parallel beta-helix repeat-containing protein [Paenibacillus sp. PAMC21692]QNK54912.1 right-handed parallel beta-helix repeat-containing protein [Paenibacillus sp. PAMC21692]